MNLVFFTVELERNRDRPVRGGSRSASRSLWSRFRWIGPAIAAAIFAAAVGCGGWVLAGGDSPFADLREWVGLSADSTRTGASGPVWLEVTSRPNKATVFVDGHEKGKTPFALAVSEATHTLVLKHPDAVDDQHTVDLSTDMHMNVSMWWRRPDAVQLKPPYPGAIISDAGFLADGRLALSIALPVLTGGLGGSVLREAWIFDPATASLDPFETSGGAPHAAVVAVSPDGRRVAYLQAAQPEMQGGGGDVRLSEVWVADEGSGRPPVRVFALPSKNSLTAPGLVPSDVEEVHDVAWTPDSRYLLVIVQLVSASGGYPAAPRSRLLVVEAPSGNRETWPPAVELVTLPAKVVPGSYIWAPDGHWVAFLTEASSGPGSSDFLAICAVDTTAGGAVTGFRYVADLARQGNPASLVPLTSLAWAPTPDGRLVYTAATPKITVTNPFGLPMSSGGEPGLFLATPAGPALTAEEGRRLGTATGLIAPAWRAIAGQDGPALMGLARSEQGTRPLIVRGVDLVDGTAQNLGIELPPTVGGSGAVAARWDLDHGRLLVVAPPEGATSGVLQYWLVQLQATQGAD